MQGHIHKRVRTDSKGKERTLWYVVVDTGVNESFGRCSRSVTGYGAHFPLGLEERFYDRSALHTCCSLNSNDFGHEYDR